MASVVVHVQNLPFEVAGQASMRRLNRCTCDSDDTVADCVRHWKHLHCGFSCFIDTETGSRHCSHEDADSSLGQRSSCCDLFVDQCSRQSDVRVDQHLRRVLQFFDTCG
uniref:Uncharacterized protein n=1 Tax=Physcomitrium patens TaxID=3218 RepID=A0A2K1IYU6_PHYPA|nr:hypothetical protein PHYPA_024266 [Physcomitrium patens]